MENGDAAPASSSCLFAGSSADRSVPSPVIAGELGWV